MLRALYVFIWSCLYYNDISGKILKYCSMQCTHFNVCLAQVIKCLLSSSANFCVTAININVYCFGSNSACLWGRNDCRSDADCSKYNINSAKFTDSGWNCLTYNYAGWARDTCNLYAVAVPTRSPTSRLPSISPTTVSPSYRYVSLYKLLRSNSIEFKWIANYLLWIYFYLFC